LILKNHVAYIPCIQNVFQVAISNRRLLQLENDQVGEKFFDPLFCPGGVQVINPWE
jgi:hypothetical protein